MIASFFHTILYQPLYNLLILLVGISPNGDVGIAVILITLIVKLVIMPLSFSALITQRRMRLIEPELKEINEKYKEVPEEKAKQTFALYKKYNLKPFSSILTLFIQIPILFSLYRIFSKEPLLHVDLSQVYSFIPLPDAISPLFLGFFTTTSHSIILTILAAAAQYAQVRFTIPLAAAKAAGETASMSEEMSRAMAVQSRFILPLLIGAISYFGSCAIALYFITSSVVALLQEVLIRRKKIAL